MTAIRRKAHGMNRPAAGLAALIALAGIAVATPAAGAARADTLPPLPAVWPTPQQVTEQPGEVRVPVHVTLVAGANTDQAALAALAAVLRSDGVTTINQVTAGNPVPRGPLTIYAGTPDDNPDVTPALDALGAQGPAGLPTGGYVLAAGHSPDGNTAVLAGVDGAGTFYAVQTLRQLITDGTLQDVVVRRLAVDTGPRHHRGLLRALLVRRRDRLPASVPRREQRTWRTTPPTARSPAG